MSVFRAKRARRERGIAEAMKAIGLPMGLAGVVALALAAAPAAADVKAGVDAWARGNYPAAVAEWKGPAARGDPDAQFNLGQAYRLGRGVPEDIGLAESYYAKAAAQGHLKAADNYGLLLFQSGRREQAMPYVAAAAERGDPRAQYLLGIAHFNGDLVVKDWVRAYALLTLSNAAGLPQAAPALTKMDGFIPLDQRQQAQSLAAELKQQSDAVRASQLASADLAMGRDEPSAAPTRQPAAAQLPAVPRVVAPAPAPTPELVAPRSVLAAEAAVAEAMRATGTESPASAGADFARAGASAGTTPRAAQVAATPQPASDRVSQSPAPAAIPAAASAPPAGPWKVQLGAFSVAANADRLWARLGDKGALVGKPRVEQKAGRLTKLQAGGFGSRAEAERACSALKSSGEACLVTR